MTFIMNDSWEGLLSRDQNGLAYGRMRAFALGGILHYYGGWLHHEMYQHI